MSYSFLNKRNGIGGRVPPLGSLELEVMNRVWGNDAPISARALQRCLERERTVSLSTVQSTVERLCRKGLLVRAKRGRAYTYAAAVSRSTLIARMLTDMVGALGGVRGAAASGFIDASEPLDEKTLRELEEWVAACRADRSKPAEEDD